MSLQRGEEIIVGVGPEETRGTAVAPSAWIPARTPSGIAPVLDKVDLKETRGTKIASYGSEIVQKRAEGDLEFNLRANTIGYILNSLLGSVSSSLKGGETVVYQHTFHVLADSPEHPSLTLGLSQPQAQDYRFALALVKALSIELSPEDLVKATASFIASSESEPGAPYSPSFATSDVYFRHQDISIKLASDVAGLGAATPIKLKNLKVDIDNGGRPDQNISELNPGNMLATVFDPKGSFELDYQNENLHDAFAAGSYQALQITMERSDTTIGNSSHPKLVLTFPRISIPKWSPNRPIDDIVREVIDFMVHYDPTNTYAIEAVLTNTIESYDAES